MVYLDKALKYIENWQIYLLWELSIQYISLYITENCFTLNLSWVTELKYLSVNISTKQLEMFTKKNLSQHQVYTEILPHFESFFMIENFSKHDIIIITNSQSYRPWQRSSSFLFSFRSHVFMLFTCSQTPPIKKKSLTSYILPNISRRTPDSSTSCTVSSSRKREGKQFRYVLQFEAKRPVLSYILAMQFAASS